jgi:hypothetical protein
MTLTRSATPTSEYRVPSPPTAAPSSVVGPARAIWPAALVLAGYAVLGVLAFHPVVTSATSRLSGPPEGDTILFTWFIAWVPHALLHGTDPFFSHAMLVPGGVNLAANTSSPLLGLLAAPVTVLAGPVVATNLLMVVAMPVSAAAAFLVLRAWHVWLPAAALGGLLYGFSPYMLGQSMAHPEFAFVPLPPLIVLVTVRILQRRGSPRALGAALGFLVAAQFLISQEVLATVTLVVAVGVVLVAVRHPAGAADLARAAWRPVAVAVLVGAVLLAYPLWMMLAGPQHYTGAPWPVGNRYHNDVLSLIAPGPRQRVPLGLRSVGTRVTVMGPTETGGYIGIPLLVVMAVLTWRSRRSPRMQLAIALLVVAVLLSLGTQVTVDGHDTGIPLPFLLLGHVPVLADILPSRFSLEIGALVAAVVAFGIDDLRRPATLSPGREHGGVRRPGPGRSAVIGVVLVALVVVVTQFPNWPYPTQSATGLPAAVRAVVPAGDPIAITYPYVTKYRYVPEMWQVEDGYRFRLLGGYALHPDATGAADLFPGPMVPAALQRYLLDKQGSVVIGSGPPPTTPTVAATRDALVRNNVRLVLVDDTQPDSDQVIALFTEALGPPEVSSGRVTAWVSRSGSL